ncbi:GspE/PulE family protein, partial [Patescibacteria group bacterium]|nr:GspE/PulE family protein [Patescibacteria group bacterium]
KSTQDAMGEINRDMKESLTEKKAAKLGMSYVNVGKQPINVDVLGLIDAETAKKAQIVPFYKLGKKIRVALAHPTSKEAHAAIDVLKEQGYQLNFNLATEESINEALQNYDKGLYKEEKEKKLVTGDVKSYAEEIKDLSAVGKQMEEMRSEDALDLLNVSAIKTKASDIHIQPEKENVQIRFRIDGLLYKVMTISKSVFEQLSNQIKYQAKLKLNITNVPQDGRYFFNIDESQIDVRVSALPTEFGETFVCRLLDSRKGLVPLKDLGFTDLNWSHLEEAIKSTEGLILLTGPTGSGKTTTLYSMLKEFNKPEVKIITLEDPIEYHIENISQSHINEKRGYTFASGLRAILRQDPDVVMVGEIRDIDTAEAAAQAALTGHVVLSTLHTNSAIESIPRLINMGLEPFIVAPACHLIIGQRLVRKICEDCRSEKALAETEKEYLEKSLSNIKEADKESTLSIPEKAQYGKGCEKCSKTGYSGRTSIVEILKVDSDIKAKILASASSKEIFELARTKGMLTMQEDGIKKILLGMTTISEVQRVTMIREE